MQKRARMTPRSFIEKVAPFYAQCKQRCETLASDAKKICVLRCRVQAEQKRIAYLRLSAMEINNPDARRKLALDVRASQLRMASYQRKLATMVALNA